MSAGLRLILLSPVSVLSAPPLWRREVNRRSDWPLCNEELGMAGAIGKYKCCAPKQEKLICVFYCFCH
jgi:hypothetical protein